MASQSPVVTGSDILAGYTPSDVEIQRLAPIQRAGLWIAAGVGLFSILALIPIMGVWWAHVPPMPPIAIDSSANPQAITDTVKVFETYKVATEMAAEQPLKWFDGLFIKILYPLLTLVLGYIFGATRQGSENNEG